MSELLKKLESLGASADKNQGLIDLISRSEIDQLVALNPNVCAFEHAPDEDEPSKDDDDDEDSLTENKQVAV